MLFIDLKAVEHVFNVAHDGSLLLSESGQNANELVHQVWSLQKMFVQALLFKVPMKRKKNSCFLLELLFQPLTFFQSKKILIFLGKLVFINLLKSDHFGDTFFSRESADSLQTVSGLQRE